MKRLLGAGRSLVVLSAVPMLAGYACGRRSAPPPAFTTLGDDAARVGTATIPASLVLQVARARDRSPSEAIDGLVQDALLSQAALGEGVADRRSVQWMSVVALARVVPERLYDESRGRGLPTDEELATVRVVHAVVLRAPTLSRSRAAALAGVIWDAVAGARSDGDFEERASRLPHPGMHVTVERLPAFDASGHAAEGQEFDATFVAAAFALHGRGETSHVVETPFGWHIIRLIERVPPDATALEQRRKDLASAILEMRVRADLTNLLRVRRGRTPIEVAADADVLMTPAASSP
jgi:hypothetical protein